MTPTTYGRDFAYCLKSHGGVRGFNASLWRFFAALHPLLPQCRYLFDLCEVDFRYSRFETIVISFNCRPLGSS